MTTAVDRDLLSRPHPQAIADKDDVERDFSLGTVGRNPARSFRCEIEERADRAGGAFPGAQLQHLAEQHQHGDCRRRLEINADGPFVAAKSRREKLRRQRRDDAVSPGDAGADGDQREHVEVAGCERMPAPHEKRPAGPQHDRSRQRQLDDVIDIWGQPNAEVDQMAAHFQHGHRQRQSEPDPEPPRHVAQFGIGRRFGRDGDGFERHAADRTGARADLPDFGMHRAGVDRAFRRHRLPARRPA